MAFDVHSMESDVHSMVSDVHSMPSKIKNRKLSNNYELLIMNYFDNQYLIS